MPGGWHGFVGGPWVGGGVGDRGDRGGGGGGRGARGMGGLVQSRSGWIGEDEI